MTIIKNGHIANELFESYLDSLVGRFYKILPMKESDSDTLETYLHSLQSELIGSKRLVLFLNNDAQFMSLINTLQFFIDNEYDVKTCKREIMKCISISKKLKEKYLNLNEKAGDIDGI